MDATLHRAIRARARHCCKFCHFPEALAPSSARDVWAEHFEWQGAELRGRTAIGRATVQTLRLNRPDAVAVRHLLMREGVFPLD